MDKQFMRVLSEKLPLFAAMKSGRVTHPILCAVQGRDKGDSSGDEGTSSDDSDNEGKSGTRGVLAKALRGRSMVRNLTSLKHLCLLTIVQNQSRLASSDSQKKIFQRMGCDHPEVIDLIFLELRPRDQIPYYEAEDVYQYCSWEFVTLLLHSNLEEFNFDLLRDKKNSGKLWPLLIKKCPKLKKITSGEGGLLPIEQLVHFKKLVEINMWRRICTDSLMKKVASNFPKLKSLEVTFYNLSATGLGHLLKLKSLEHLQFSLETGSSVKKKSVERYNSTLIAKCLANLPNLRFCQPDKYSDLYMSAGLAEFCGDKKSSRKVLKLESLLLKKTLGIPPEQVPMVKAVTIEGPVTCGRELAKLTCLEKLSLSGVSYEHVMLILKKLGRQIKQLKIDNQYMQELLGNEMETMNTTFDFYEIFLYCPNLEVFYLGGQHFRENPKIPISAANFSKLRSVEVQMYDSDGYLMPMPIVEHILRAEHLEHLNLYWARCLPRALYNVLSENNERHFRNLKFLHLERMWVKNLRGYIRSLKTLVGRAPKLQFLGIICCQKGVEEFKSSGLRQLLAQIPNFGFKADYKDGFY